MRHATLISSVLLCLLGSVAPALSTPINRGSPAAPAPRAAPSQADDDEPAQQATSRAGSTQQSGRSSDRRRRSYASCNRDSHKRNLRGGARRRFLIRCKLGYEKRQPAAQLPRQGEPAPPGKRP